ncbi:MAG: ABC transporter permease [Bacteroidetes bacterium RIFCSPLOWO2_02_FULL_36_8]|nr:MAG: ABC transporter permease [Bacteroidetes bacterium RIFCSPLOWO2_02_FULL_36_8]OFY70407.1 MAG: ABC transporter permease [Bacteroidetes bacterium RIFCSPLOWO2_12_FULL_37_12]
MRTILYILQKEFIQIFRNRMMLPIIFVAPVVQLLILSNAATFEIRKANMVVVDSDHSILSREMVSHFSGTTFFNILRYCDSYPQAEKELIKNNAKIILLIPRGLEKNFLTRQKPQVQFIIHAEDGAAAGVLYSYAGGILANFNKSKMQNQSGALPVVSELPKTIDIRTSYWYNPELNYKTYMIPGILVLLVTMIGIFLTGMNIVREKEIGTIEQLNVTPIKKYQFIIGKLLPFWLLAQFILAFGLGVSKLVFHIPIAGSVWLIFGFAAVYLLVVISIGLFISTITDTQQQAMFFAWFFMMIFMLLGGLFTSIENMPEWVKKITWFNPIAYFIDVMRRIMLKGATFEEIRFQFGIMVVYAIGMIGLSTWRYRKVSA